MKEKRLYRSTSDKVLTGLAGGIAEYFSIDPSIVRVGIVVATFLTGGSLALAYLIAALVVPKAPEPPK